GDVGFSDTPPILLPAVVLPRPLLRVPEQQAQYSRSGLRRSDQMERAWRRPSSARRKSAGAASPVVTTVLWWLPPEPFSPLLQCERHRNRRDHINRVTTQYCRFVTPLLNSTECCINEKNMTADHPSILNRAIF